MSRQDSKVDNSEFFDTKYSSGDSNKMNSKKQYKEENNNDIDELSKDFDQMGCIVDAVKRPPNICVETYVYEGPEDDNVMLPEANEDDNYSDEFEDDKSEGEHGSVELDPMSVKSEVNKGSSDQMDETDNLKLTKSQSAMSNRRAPSTSGRSSYGSLPVPQTHRINMSFTNDRLREIERHNHILLNKILRVRKQNKSSIPPREDVVKRLAPPSAAVQRKRQQREIDRENLILLKKIQCAKSSACSIRR